MLKYFGTTGRENPNYILVRPLRSKSWFSSLVQATIGRRLYTYRHRMKSLVCGATIAITLASPAIAGAQQSPDAFRDLRTVLVSLQEAIASLEPGDTRSRMNDDVQWLLDRHSQTERGAVTEPYVRSLQRAAELLNAGPTDEVIADIAADLQAKREHCRELKIGMGGTVILRINTRRGPADIGDWQVLYMLKIYEWTPGVAPLNFPRLSTPTEMALEPGRYWIWARNPANGTVSERVLIKAAGRRELPVDLVVP